MSVILIGSLSLSSIMTDKPVSYWDRFGLTEKYKMWLSYLVATGNTALAISGIVYCNSATSAASYGYFSIKDWRDLTMAALIASGVVLLVVLVDKKFQAQFGYVRQFDWLMITGLQAVSYAFFQHLYDHQSSYVDGTDYTRTALFMRSALIPMFAAGALGLRLLVVYICRTYMRQGVPPTSYVKNGMPVSPHTQVTVHDEDEDR